MNKICGFYLKNKPFQVPLVIQTCMYNYKRLICFKIYDLGLAQSIHFGTHKHVCMNSTWGETEALRVKLKMSIGWINEIGQMANITCWFRFRKLTNERASFWITRFIKFTVFHKHLLHSRVCMYSVYRAGQCLTITVGKTVLDCIKRKAWKNARTEMVK